MSSKRRSIIVTLLSIVGLLVVLSFLPFKNIIEYLPSDVRNDLSYVASTLEITRPTNINSEGDKTTHKKHNKEDEVVFDWKNSFHPTEIRRWGCDRSETPLIFVHIGKAGGGEIRPRFAASALDYDRGGNAWRAVTKDRHYYPISEPSTDDGGKGFFCNSMMNNFRLPNSTNFPKSYEGNADCEAATPLGMAVACPQYFRSIGQGLCLGCRNLEATTCHTVYVGHNNMGTELHWLPPKYLQNWWRTSPWSAPRSNLDDSSIVEALQSLMPSNTSWCPKYHQARPKHSYEAHRVYVNCSVPLAHRMDSTFREYWRQQQQPQNNAGASAAPLINYSPIYASLPVQRVVMLREPFSWLLSKFSWHKIAKKQNTSCETLSSKWAYGFCVGYILNLCGVDCVNRYDLGRISLEEMEAQASDNLRQSFSVVGLLKRDPTNSTSMSFYDMITTRIHYVNMSLNPHVTGQRHPSQKGSEIERCAKVFQQPDFQERSKREIPIVAAVDRLYQLGVQVNRFQQEELRQCQEKRDYGTSKQPPTRMGG